METLRRVTNNKSKTTHYQLPFLHTHHKNKTKNKRKNKKQNKKMAKCWVSKSRQEPMSRSMQLYYIPVTVFTDKFIFKPNFPAMRLPRECYDQSQESNRRNCVTGPELPFFHKRKDVLKIFIEQSVKMP